MRDSRCETCDAGLAMRGPPKVLMFDLGSQEKRQPAGAEPRRAVDRSPTDANASLPLFLRGGERDARLTLGLDYEHCTTVELSTRLVAPGLRGHEAGLAIADRFELGRRETLRSEIV